MTIIHIRGPRGSGKTTLAKFVASLYEPESEVLHLDSLSLPIARVTIAEKAAKPAFYRLADGRSDRVLVIEGQRASYNHMFQYVPEGVHIVDLYLRATLRELSPRRWEWYFNRPEEGARIIERCAAFRNTRASAAAIVVDAGFSHKKVHLAVAHRLRELVW